MNRRIMLAYLFLISFIFCSILPDQIEARRLQSDSKAGKNVAFGSMKNSGPSRGGAGHKIIKHLEIVRVGRKDSGPSPGEGHRYVDVNHHN